MTPLLLLHAAATLVLVGLIWTVQLAVYPLFPAIGGGSFADYHAAYMRRITLLVAPLMGVEAITALLLIELGPPAVPRSAALLGAALLVVIWGSTALIQVPLHARAGATATRHRLALSNWIRTAAWSARGALALWMCSQAAPTVA